jgi:hypothetical protein
MNKKALIIILQDVFDKRDIDRLPEIIKALENDNLMDQVACIVIPPDWDEMNRTMRMIMGIRDDKPIVLDHQDEMRTMLQSLTESIKDFKEITPDTNRGFDYREANKAPRSAKRKR